MTDMAIDKDHTEPFWSRVRTALVALRPEREPALGYGQAVLARSVGIMPKLGTRIEEELARGWAHAAARRVSMSLLIVEIDCFADYFSAYGDAEAQDCLSAVRNAITAALPRQGDTCLQLGASSFVLVLPDLPVLLARAMAGKIVEAVRLLAIPHKESHAGIVTLSLGLAVTNPQGGYDRKFFEAAAGALKKARRKGMGRLEGVDLRPALERQKRAA